MSVNEAATRRSCIMPEGRPVPIHGDCDLDRGLAASVLRDAGYSVEDSLRSKWRIIQGRLNVAPRLLAPTSWATAASYDNLHLAGLDCQRSAEFQTHVEACFADVLHGLLGTRP